MKKKHTLFEVHRGKDKQWYIRIVARNGRTLMSSEGYRSKRSALRCLVVILNLVEDSSKEDWQICEG